MVKQAVWLLAAAMPLMAARAESGANASAAPAKDSESAKTVREQANAPDAAPKTAKQEKSSEAAKKAKDRAVLIKSVQNALDELGYKYEREDDDEGDALFRMEFASELDAVDGYRVILAVSGDYILSRAKFPLRGAGKNRARVEAYLNRLNWVHRWTTASMDVNDGEIVCDYPMSSEYVALNPRTAVGTALGFVIGEWDNYGNGLIGVLSGAVDPDEAFEKEYAKKNRNR